MIKVTLITLEGCSHCAATLKALQSLKSEYTDLKIEDIPTISEKGKKLIQQYDIKAAPAIFINDRYFQQGEATEEEFRKQFSLLKTQ